jgi:apolipoprotein N-acyltransferase
VSARAKTAAAVLSGALLVVCFPLADFGSLAFVALVPLLLALQGSTPRDAARRGFLCGAVFFSGLLYWLVHVMTHYGGLPVVVGIGFLLLLVGWLALFFGGFAACQAALLLRRGPMAFLFAPVLFVAFEIARGRLLTGFPWGLIGYTQWRRPGLVQLTAWGGIYALSFLVVLVNAAIALFLAPGGVRRRRIGAAAAALLVAAGAGFLGKRALAGVAHGDGVPLTVAAIQANVPQEMKWLRGREQEIVSGLLTQSAAAAAQGARLVVWPESSSPLALAYGDDPHAPATPPARDRQGFEQVVSWVRQARVTLLTGSVAYRRVDGRLRAYNSAFVIGPDGVPAASYDKVHLVPFGEYVPLQRLLFFVDRMVQGAVAEFLPGERFDPLPTAEGHAGTFICYEAIFPELVRRVARHADFLVNITNDAWFGKSAAPYQHLAMAAVRAAENRRWMVRAANTGISAIIDPAGRVRRRTPLEVETILLGSVAPRSDTTLYARTGDRLAWACVILTAVLAAVHRSAFARAPRSAGSGPPRPAVS